jgi:hypothetical protein
MLPISHPWRNYFILKVILPLDPDDVVKDASLAHQSQQLVYLTLGQVNVEHLQFLQQWRAQQLQKKTKFKILILQ